MKIVALEFNVFETLHKAFSRGRRLMVRVTLRKDMRGMSRARFEFALPDGFKSPFIIITSATPHTAEAFAIGPVPASAVKHDDRLHGVVTIARRSSKIDTPDGYADIQVMAFDIPAAAKAWGVWVNNFSQYYPQAAVTRYTTDDN